MSLKVPVAVNCCVVASAILGVGGVIAIDTRLAPVTVNVVDAVRSWNVALRVAEPALMASA